MSKYEFDSHNNLWLYPAIARRCPAEGIDGECCMRTTGACCNRLPGLVRVLNALTSLSFFPAARA